MKHLLALLFLVVFNRAEAVQKATIVSPEVEIYSGADYDSDVMDTVHEGEVYFISDKTVGPFYRIKLKSGKIGYISDYELDIEGKGRIPEKDLDEVFLEADKKRAKNARTEEQEVDEEEEAIFGRSWRGVTVQVVNYHENTMGSDQVADLLAVGYKSISQFSWSVIGSYGAPKYYNNYGTGATGGQLWADLGFSNPLVSQSATEVRYGASVFTHLSVVHLETPTRNYDLHDVTLGVALEAGWLIKVGKKNAFDVGLKYYFDKTSYAGLGLSFLF